MHTDTARARDALQYISPNLPRDEWARIGMAAKSAGLDFDDWDAWCSNGASYNPRDARDTWRSIKADGGITPASLFHAARAAGWREGGKPQHASPSKAVSRPAEPPRAPRPGMNPAEVWGRCEPATPEHSYCLRKGLSGAPLAGLRAVPEGDALRIAGHDVSGWLVVPAHAHDGTLQSLQFIPPPGIGKKLNLPGASMAGARFIVGAPAPGQPLYLCEGVSAAWAAWQATGHAAICCFGWGNVGTVARAIRKRDNAALLVICPDVGKESSADEIANEIGCMVAAMPEGWPQNSDVNDLSQAEGHDVLADLLERASEPPKPEPHPLAVYVDMSQPLRPPSWLLPGFLSAEPGLTDYRDFPPNQQMQWFS